MKPAVAWPLAIVGVLGVTVVANGVLLWAASAPESSAVAPDYYRRALAWDTTQAAAVRSSNLGWRAQAVFGPPAAGGAQLRVTLLDAGGAAVAGARLRVVGVHNLDSTHPSEWGLTEIGSGEYAALVPLPHQGRWELRVSAERGGQRFSQVLHADAERAGR